MFAHGKQVHSEPAVDVGVYHVAQNLAGFHHIGQAREIIRWDFRRMKIFLQKASAQTGMFRFIMSGEGVIGRQDAPDPVYAEDWKIEGVNGAAAVAKIGRLDCV